MKKKSLYIILGASILVLSMGILIGRLSKSGSTIETVAEAPAEAKPTTWTCSMHPQIQTAEMGDCPICGMDLIPLSPESAEDLGPRAMTMSESALALADIQTTVVKRDFPIAEVDLVGRLELDQTRIKSLTARFPARIDKLYVNYMGIPVKEGEHLALIYSPELSSAEHELLMAHQSDPSGSLALAAREKLRLWDLLPEQIDAIIQSGEASDTFDLMAPGSGVVIEKNVNEGDYFVTGQSLFKIADLGRLWLMLDAYESDLPWLRYGQAVEFTVEAWPGERFQGTIAFIEPELNRMTRTVSIRVNVPNADGRLKPGMFARGTVKAQVASDGKVFSTDMAGKWISPMHPEIIKDGPGECDVCGMDLVPAESLGYLASPEGEAPVVVPSSAVLRTGQRAVVYLQVPGRDQPTFEGQEIVLGPRAGNVFLVKEGLSEGDRVVTNGAFKIDSALQIQAKPSMMSPEAGTPMTGHSGHDMEKGEPGQHQVAEISIQLTTSMAVEILPDYFALQSALASDDLAASKAALKDMMSKTGHMGPLPDLIHTMLAADSLNGIRRPHFDTLSSAFIEIVKAHAAEFPGDIYLMRCPMVYDDRADAGADWLQSDAELLNPYFGSMMLHCGETLSKIK